MKRDTSRMSSFEFLPEHAQAFSGKLSTISNVRLGLDNHFCLLARPEEGRSFFGNNSCFEKRHSFSDERNRLSTAKIINSKRDIPMFSNWGGRKIKKPMQAFCTGSRYLGEWNGLGFTGEGVYRYPHGVIYEGEFSHDGLFHGIGTLTYPNGQKVQGIWRNGMLTEDSTFIFACGEMIDDDFRYCQKPDRRFHIEIQKEFGPAGQEYLTNDQPTKKLPEGCYDVRNGLYDPKTGCIMSFPKTTIEGSDNSIRKSTKRDVYFDPNNFKEKQMKEISGRGNVASEVMMATSLVYNEEPYEVGGQMFIEIPSVSKVAWIKENCRKAWDENTGYRPDLYETWMAGRRYEAFLQDADNSIDDDEHEWLNNGENIRAKDEQTTKFVKFVLKNTVPNEKPYRLDKLKSSRSCPIRHEYRQKIHDRSAPNSGNISKII